METYVQNAKKASEELRAKGYVFVSEFGWILKERAIELHDKGYLVRDPNYGLMFAKAALNRYEVSSLTKYLRGDIKALKSRPGLGDRVIEFGQEQFKGM